VAVSGANLYVTSALEIIPSSPVYASAALISKFRLRTLEFSPSRTHMIPYEERTWMIEFEKRTQLITE
jgi:hypothetical protein